VFKSKITFSVITFLICLIITAIIKNETRTFEKKIYQLNKKISLKEKDLNDSQFDFYYLTSPVIIEKKIENLSYNNYFPMEYSKIFLNLSDFTNIQKKITTLKNLNEKKKN
jgi:lipopolysaccharide export LptBFGC system permease protein LptF